MTSLPNGFMSVKDASKRLGVTQQTVRSAIEREEIKAVKRFARWWVSVDSVDRLLKIDERAAHLCTLGHQTATAVTPQRVRAQRGALV